MLCNRRHHTGRCIGLFELTLPLLLQQHNLKNLQWKRTFMVQEYICNISKWWEHHSHENKCNVLIPQCDCYWKKKEHLGTGLFWFTHTTYLVDEQIAMCLFFTVCWDISFDSYVLSNFICLPTKSWTECNPSCTHKYVSSVTSDTDLFPRKYFL